MSAVRALTAVRPRRRHEAADPFRRRRTAALAGVAAAAVAAGAWWILTGPPVGIHGVTLAGYEGPNKAAVETTARLVAGEGTIVDLPEGAMRAALTRFPWIEDVRITRDLPRAITVSVTQARPAAVGVPARGHRVLVAADGRVLGRAPERGGLARVRLPGAAPPEGERVGGEEARRSLELIRALPAAVAGRLRDMRIEDGKLVGRLAAGPEIRLGPPESLALKAESLTAVLGHLTPEEQAKAAYLDVSVPERPALGRGPDATDDGGAPTA